MFISILYMLRAGMCQSSGELLYQYDIWYMSLWCAGMQEHMTVWYAGAYATVWYAGAYASAYQTVIHAE